MTWPDPRWHDRCTNCEHERCDHDYPKKGDPCHTCNLNGNLLGGSVCQRFEEKAKLNPGAWDDYQEALQYAYFCRCGKISVGPEGAPTRCGNCVTLTVWLRYRATLPEEWRQRERCARCWVPRSHHPAGDDVGHRFIDEKQAQEIRTLEREQRHEIQYRNWPDTTPHVCTWVPHAKTLLKSCCGDYRRIEPPRKRQPIRYRYQRDPILAVVLVVGVTTLFRLTWWVIKHSAIGTAYGYQVWWWILTGRGSPPMLTMDGSDLSEASAPARQLSPTEVRY